jgi:splicing factor 3A subunit 2
MCMMIGQLSDSQAGVERRERLRKLALETIDISKDPYFMRNHLGSYECKLCLTLHNNEGYQSSHSIILSPHELYYI